MINPRIFDQYAILVTMGYLGMDLIICTLVIRDFSALGMQSYIHHFIGLFAIGGSLFVNIPKQPMIISGMANIFTEISTPFMNNRQFCFTHGLQDSLFAKVNSILFFLSFLFGRFLYQMILAYKFF